MLISSAIGPEETTFSVANTVMGLAMSETERTRDFRGRLERPLVIPIGAGRPWRPREPASIPPQERAASRLAFCVHSERISRDRGQVIPPIFWTIILDRNVFEAIDAGKNLEAESSLSPGLSKCLGLIQFFILVLVIRE